MSDAATTIATPAVEYRARAWEAAGIDAATAARLAREHGALRPAAVTRLPQRAVDVIDLDERARLMRGVAALYGRLYAAAPERFLWAGFAAVAVNDGVRPAAEVTRLAAEATRLAAELSPALGCVLAPVGCAAEDGLKCAFETNYAIFADLGWAHLAYLDGGIDALRRFRAEGAVAPELLAGFEDVDRGARLGGEAGDALVVRGNLALFRHEQRVSVTPVFTRYGDAMAFATRVGLIGVPNGRLAARAGELGRSPEWSAANAPGESYGPFAARWRWLVRHAWEPLVTLHRDRRARGCRGLADEVARAVEGRPEGAVPVADGRARAALRLAAVAASAALSLAAEQLRPSA